GVARMRRALGERRIGHAGTLDPAATGVLPLVLGRATRLAQFLTESDKSYEAVVRFGFATDTHDAQGHPVGPVRPVTVSRDEIDRALEPFRGTFPQQPPAFSAKKIGGKRSHKLARARARDARLKPTRDGSASDLRDPRDLSVASALPAAVSVTVSRLEIVRMDAGCVTLSGDCSAGFYVRSLAHGRGGRLGVGAHLAALRRTRAGDFTLDRALALERAERDPAAAAAAVVRMADALPRLPAVALTAEGVRRAHHGCRLGAADVADGRFFVAGGQPPLARLLDVAGHPVRLRRIQAPRAFPPPPVLGLKTVSLLTTQ